MGHQNPDFETKDVLGKTLQYAGSVGTSNLALPDPSVGKISEFLLRNPDTNAITEKLLVSLDGGTTFFGLARGEFIGWTPKNNASNMPIEQLVIKGSTAAVDYELILNIEP
jgi:hypothetical protein